MKLETSYLVYLTIVAICVLSGIVMLDHMKIDSQTLQIQQQNTTIQNIANFLVNQQIPLDQQIVNYTRSHP